MSPSTPYTSLWVVAHVTQSLIMGRNICLRAHPWEQTRFLLPAPTPRWALVVKSFVPPFTLQTARMLRRIPRFRIMKNKSWYLPLCQKVSLATCIVDWKVWGAVQHSDSHWHSVIQISCLKTPPALLCYLLDWFNSPYEAFTSDVIYKY